MQAGVSVCPLSLYAYLPDAVYSDDMKVQKRDGNLEDFDQEKIARVMVAAGLTPEQATEIATTIASWSQAQAADTILSTYQIREKLLELLTPTYPAVANLYAWYEQGKDR